MIKDEAERTFIEQLRKESHEVKDCFTRYSFQAMALVSALFVAILSLIHDHQLVALAAVPIILLLQTVSKIGLHKYTSSNRILGYELHLARLWEQLEREKDDRVRKVLEQLRSIRWEEALRAWRIVQVAVYRKIYHTPQNVDIPQDSRWLVSLWGRRLKLYDLFGPFHKQRVHWQEGGSLEPELAIAENNVSYHWFHLQELTRVKPQPTSSEEDLIDRSKGAEGQWYSLYHGGDYLDRMIRVLLYLQVIAISIVAYAAAIKLMLVLNPDTRDPWNWFKFGAYTMVVVLGAYQIYLVHERNRRRRSIIENGLLSIHSCGIVWNAVAVAHTLACERALQHHHYSEQLLRIAIDLTKDLGRIHGWIQRSMKQLMEPSGESGTLQPENTNAGSGDLGEGEG